MPGPRFVTHRGLRLFAPPLSFSAVDCTKCQKPTARPLTPVEGFWPVLEWKQDPALTGSGANDRQQQP